jgi:hypothetical protein
VVGVIHFKVIDNNVEVSFYISEYLFEARVPGHVEVLRAKGYIDGILTFDDVEISTFHDFMRWLKAADPNGQSLPDSVPLLKLHKFASEYSVPLLCADIERVFAVTCIGAIQISLLKGPNIAVYFHQEIRLIYKHTTPDSPLRKGVVNAICAGEDNNEESLMEYPKEFLADVILHRKKRWLHGRR